MGENRFTSISLESGRLVSETPEPTNMISVRPGDVVGFHQSIDANEDGDVAGSNDGIQLQPGYSNERMIFYQTSASNVPPSTLMAGEERPLTISTNGGPMMSVSVCEFPTA